MTPDAIARPTGFSHVRLTVTDIERSKAFYSLVFGTGPAHDFTGDDDPSVHDDPNRSFGGCSFRFGDQILGLRPAAADGDRFSPTRVGLDHLSLALGSTAELHDAVGRLDAAGIEHGDYTPLPAFGLAIVSFQDPDDINLEFAAPLE